LTRACEVEIQDFYYLSFGSCMRSCLCYFMIPWYFEILRKKNIPILLSTKLTTLYKSVRNTLISYKLVKLKTNKNIYYLFHAARFDLLKLIFIPSFLTPFNNSLLLNLDLRSSMASMIDRGNWAILVSHWMGDQKFIISRSTDRSTDASEGTLSRWSRPICSR
jgi:hypothetical protein